MDRRQRSNLAIGVLLILLGGWFLAAQFIPGFKDWIWLDFSWPMIIIGVGGLLLVMGLMMGVPSMAVPACIVGGIGALLYWQNVTGRWDSWAYVWTLIPGFVGLGTILAGVLGGRARQALGEGGRLLLTSLVLFCIFGAVFGALGFFGNYWPVLLIVGGLLLLIQTLFRSRK